jgi:hypothetical protein
MKWIALALLYIFQSAVPQTQPGTPEEPVRVIGGEIDLDVHDGRLRPAIGIENIEVMRANRTHPELGDGYGWTYNHAPMLAYWNGKFYLEYLSNPFGEHLPPGQTLVATSKDGRNWDLPRQVFPIYLLRPGPISGNESGMAMMHQRMGFYVAPNGRLLVLAFYGHAPSPWGATGIGRVVREAYKDGTYGPVYFLRYNSLAGAGESDTTTFPFYARSKDSGFVEACNALLGDKLKTMQWQEEDRSTDGFYTVPGRLLEAPSVYHRKDGAAVALWKASWAGLSRDEGHSWTVPVKVPTIITDGAKTWGQRTDDGRYAIIYNPANFGSHRWPLAIATGEDGALFDNMLLINGDVAPRRFFGRAKDFGLQYVRGICEGNGNPPGSDLWITYSSNKEDIWVSRVPVPVRSRVEGEVEDNFNKLAPGGSVPGWNLHQPRWARTGVVPFPSASNRSIQLEDRDPYDYAKAVRIFEEAPDVRIAFKLYPRQIEGGRLEIEVLDGGGRRPVRIVFGANGRISAADGGTNADGGPYRAGAWHNIEIAVHAGDRNYTLLLNGKPVVSRAAFAEAAGSVERICFRTGEYRTTPTRQTDRYAGGDLPDPDNPVKAAVYNIDDLTIRK